MSSRTILASSLLVLLAGAAAWLALGGRDVPAPAADTRVLEGDDGQTLDPADLSAATADAAFDDGDTHGLGGSPQREAIAFAGSANGTDGPVLRVVEAATRRPIAGAEVFAAEGDVRSMRGARHWADVLETSHPARRTDAEGRVALFRPQRTLLVAARAPGLFGAARFHAQEREPVLELVPDRTILVRVVDHAGRAAPRVHVALCADLGARVERLAHVPTDDEGMAVLRHAQLYERWIPAPDPAAAERAAALREAVEQERAALARRALARGASAAEQQLLILRMQERQAAERSRAARGARTRGPRTGARDERLRGGGDPRAAGMVLADFVVLAEVPQAFPAHARVTPTVLSPDPIELRLLPWTEVSVRIVGPGGVGVRVPCHVELRPRTEPDADPLRRTLDPLCTLSREKLLGDDSVRLAPVGLGLTLDVRVRFPDDDFSFTREGVPGPTNPGPYEIVVQTPEWFSVVAGRLVDAEGAPLPAAKADFFVAGAKGRIEGEKLRLLADSAFELPVRLREPAPPYALEIQTQLGDRRCGTLVALPGLGSVQRIDLGDVVLADVPVLALGTVRDDLGRALFDADVVLLARRGERFTAEDGVRERTDPEGRFTLYGALRAFELRVRATARGHAPAEQAIRPGQRVDLTLQRTGAILAEGTLPAGVPHEAVRALLAPSHQGARPRELGVRPRGDGRFELRIPDLAPGTYPLTLNVRGLHRPLARADVVVPPGETIRPAGIDGIDLRGRLFAYVVAAVDGEGRALRDPGSPLLVELHDASGQRRLTPFPWRGDRVEFIADAPSVSAVGLAPGCRPVHAMLTPGENKLAFARVHPLRLLLPGLRAAIGPEQRARISLVFAGDTGLPGSDLQGIDQRSGQARGYPRAALGKSSGAPLGAGDEVEVPLMLDGRYEIVLRVDGPGGRVSKTIGTVQAVLGDAERSKVTVVPDLAAARDAVAELRARPPRR